ncbi:MAG: sigma-70 family RNA polymerase sigma factor [candidate division Zixibacteria bacterium]|nr:sigma-70 family RNA polymerase sigma factor [candidate division Zixibacteria bacterium]
MRQILAKAISGDKSAEEELFKYLRVRFTIIAQQRLRDDSFEDIAQDACVTVVEKYKDLSPNIEFEAWAYKILRNKIGSHLRDLSVRNRAVKIMDNIDNIYPTQENPEARRILIRCLEKLAKVYPRYIRVLSLVNYGYSTEEICDQLKVSSNNFYVILHRCRGLLSDCVYGRKVNK